MRKVKYFALYFAIERAVTFAVATFGRAITKRSHEPMYKTYRKNDAKISHFFYGYIGSNREKIYVTYAIIFEKREEIKYFLGAPILFSLTVNVFEVKRSF